MDETANILRGGEAKLRASHGALLLLLVLWLVVAVAAGMFVVKPAAAASGQIAGNPTCKSLLNNERAYKIKVGADGIKNGAKYGPITFKNVNSAKTLMGFDTTIRVKGVFVKGGPEGGYFYDYRLPDPPGGSLGDANMGTNGYGHDRYQISHVSFCWDGKLVAQPDVYDVDEDGTLEVGTASGVLGNDADLEGGQITAELVSSPSNGTLTLRADGSFTYTPNKDFTGTDAFAYSISDGKGGTATATVTITVKPVNDAPVAKDLTGESDQVTTPEDTPKDVTLEASDVDSNNLTFSIVNGPANGTLSGSGANLTYTPNKDFNGTDSFTYKVCDDSTPEPLCDEGRIDINVTPVNDPPEAVDDRESTGEDNPVTVNVLANDYDPEGDPLTVTSVSDPANGTATINPDGAVRYAPDANFDGADVFTYELCDTGGLRQCDIAQVDVTVNPVNDAPVVRDDRGSTGASAAMRNSYISQYASSTTSTRTRLYQPNTARLPYTLTKVGADIAGPMNAIGYRSTDRSIYGYRMMGTRGIMKVNPNTGAARYLGNPRGLSTSRVYYAGDVSPNGSTYYLYAPNTRVLWRVNLTTFRASSVNLSSVLNVPDFAVSPTDGNLYGVAKDGRLLRVDPRTGRVTASSVAGLKPGGYGAAWFTAQGDLIAYENGSPLTPGTIAWIARPATAPSVVSSQAAPSIHGNDGAAYVGPTNPAGLSVEVDVLANDGDPDGSLDRNTLRIVQPPANGTVRINADKTITYTSGSSYRGADSFRYEVCDDGAPRECATAAVNITSVPITSPAASRKE